MQQKANFRVDPKLTAVLGDAYQSTEKALCELVDNAWDADAENVWVSIPLELSASIADAPIVVRDDGTGMTDAEVKRIYLKIANDRFSRHKSDRTVGKKRLVKGRKGIGKFSGLSAAACMTLETVARGTTTTVTIEKGVLLKTQGGRDLEKVDLPFATAKADPTRHGTTITLSKLDQTKSLPSPQVLKRLLIREYGREDGFNVFVNGERLAVTDLGGRTSEASFAHSEIGPVRVRWTIAERPLPRSEAGFVYRISGKVVGEPTFCGLEDELDIPEKVRNRVYGEIEADGLASHVTADWGDIVENSLPLREIKDRVRNEAATHLREVCRVDVNMARARLAQEYKRRIETLPEHRREHAYDAVERVIQKYFPEGDEKVRLLVTLVLDALEKDEYFKVCENIARATGADVATLAECLDEFGLVDMAVIGQQARNRLRVLDDIDRLVSSPQSLEAQVHKALEHNLWVLGPQYSLIASNKTLKRVVSDYCDKEFKGSRANKRPDLFLGQSVDDRKLLIEFKRPNAVVGRDAEAQAKKYRDDLTPSHGAMNVLILGGTVDATMSAAYQTTDLSFRSYATVISSARTQLSWLLRELSEQRASR